MPDFAPLWDQFTAFLPRLLLAMIILLVAFLIGRLLGRALSLVLSRAAMAETHRTFFRNLAVLGTTLLGLSVALGVIGLSGVAAGLLAGGGMAAIALGFAFRGVGENLLAGLFLAFSRPFNRGDLIACSGHEGIVRDLTLRHTQIRTGDGRDIYLPNALIFSEPVVNYTKDGLRRPTFMVGIDYHDDLGAACGVITATLERLPGSLRNPAPRAVVWHFAETHAQIEASFWIDTMDPGSDFALLRSAAMESCRVALIERGFTLSGDVTARLELSGGLQAPDSLPRSPGTHRPATAPPGAN